MTFFSLFWKQRNCPPLKTALVKKWPEFGKATKGLRHTYTDHEFEYCRSDALRLPRPLGESFADDRGVRSHK